MPSDFTLPLTAAILALTVLLVFRRPWGLPEGVWAALGAGATLATGAARVEDVVASARETAGILVFLIAIMVLAALAEAAGVFRWLAGWTLITARGRGWLLFVNLYVLGALTTLFLSLDVTAVVLTPLVLAIVLPLRLDARPFVYACAFVANTASLALPVSNLTNMLVYELLEVPFWDFVRYLALPNLVALAVNLGLLLALFWRALPGRLRVAAPADDAGDPRHVPPGAFFRLSLGTLAATVALLLAAGVLDWPFWPVAFGAASALGGLALARRWVPLRLVAGAVAWSLPPFVVGMAVIVTALYRAAAPLLDGLAAGAASLPAAGALAAAAGLASLGANAVNNLPLSLGAIHVVRAVPAELVAADGVPLRPALAFGALLGVDLGSCVTVTGSLATMLCLEIARRQGVLITPGAFLRVGLMVTLPTLAAATAVTALLVR